MDLNWFKRKEKEKVYCIKCKIRVNTFRSKGIEYQDGFLCGSCAAHYTKQMLEKRKVTIE